MPWKAKTNMSQRQEFGGSAEEAQFENNNWYSLPAWLAGVNTMQAIEHLGNTLITISGYIFSNQELMDLIDGLEEEGASDINFKVINRTIGR